MPDDLGDSPTKPEPRPDPEFADCRGGPAAGMQIRTGKELEWVGVVLDENGRPIVDCDDQGVAVTLPEDANETTEVLLRKPRRRWECYRRVGATIPELGIHRITIDDLPLPPAGTVVYRWVSAGDRR